MWAFALACAGCAFQPIASAPHVASAPAWPVVAVPLALDDTVRVLAPLPRMQALPAERAPRERIDDLSARETAELARRQPSSDLEAVRSHNHDRLSSLARCIRVSKALLDDAAKGGAARPGAVSAGDAAASSAASTAQGAVRQRLQGCQTELLDLLGRCSRKETPC